MSLIAELQRPPTADEVAERAGVSAATLFRYFPTLDELRTEAVGRFAERNDHLVEVPDVGIGALEARIDALVSARLDMYEAVAPMARFARARASETPVLAAAVDGRRQVMEKQVAAHFAAELDRLDDLARSDLVDTIVVLTSFEAWDLAVTAGRSRDDVSRATTSALHRLLA